VDRERLLELCKRLLADMFIAERCLNCEEVLSEKFSNGEEVIHSAFFELARQSFLYTGTIILCKAFDSIKEDNKPISIGNILQWLGNTVSLNKEQREQFEKLKCEYQSQKSLVKLKDQRDKFYAHNDKISPEDLVERSTWTRTEKRELIRFALRVLSFVISVCKDEPYCCYRAKDESSMGLKYVLKDLDQYHHVVRPWMWEQLKRSVENDQPTP